MTALKRAKKKGFFVFAIWLSIFLGNPAQANNRHASIVVDADTGAVLHESHADASRYPASLTKMMTLYMLFEALGQRKITLDTQMHVSSHAASMPATNINLQAGDMLSVRDAIPALIVRSANDVAAVVAEALGNTEANFGRMMTDKARKLGMHSTIFRNASGLPNNEQKTTARDLVTLSTRLMKDFPQHYHYFSTQSFSYKGTTYNSHNRMVRNTDGVDGLKTGFIRASGFNVATSAKRGNRRVIAVVMGGSTAAARDQQMAQLLDRSFNGSVASAQLTSNTDNVRNTRVSPVVQKASAPASLPKKIVEPAATTKMAQAESRAETKKMVLPKNKNWEIQIGSYHAHDRAQAQAQAATRWIPGSVVITEVEVSKRKLYRARLVGLQENQARNACQNLSRQKMECLVIRTHG
ncbi:MAG: D-alanyl-D-alanine carboxypeptidase [Nitrosomonas sp.]|nr:D-alanyl-D-alanine carboxypeptidase [Nitrosomonas sp.]